jgi:S1-C subfamily serine protease
LAPQAKPAASASTIWVVAVVAAILAAVVTSGMFIAFQSDSTTVTQAATTPPTSASVDPIGNPAPGGLDIQALLQKAQPSVVSIHVGEDSAGVYGAAGSGVVVDTDGTVLTNAHVVQGETNMEVTLFDGSRHDAELVGSLPDNDVALIRIKEPKDLVAAELGSAETTKVGDPVVAIGNALNLGGPPSVTEGIVSAKDRSIPVPGSRLEHLIQTDAAINPGNSGGALLNAAGQVIGIPTAIISDAQNIGFAISIDEVKPLIEQLRAGGGSVTPNTAFLGVSTQGIGDINTEVKRQYGVTRDTGAFVTEVTPNSAASDAGLEPGDVIVSIDGTAVNEPVDVGTAVRAKKAGDQITIDYQRKGETRSATTTLRTRKDSGN